MGRPQKVSFDDSYVPEPNSGCWLWTGVCNPLGYGQIWIRDISRLGGWRKVSAHRHAYERFVGPIADGLEIDHKCRVRCCVNPDHLQAITHLENIRRSTRWRPAWEVDA